MGKNKVTKSVRSRKISLKSTLRKALMLKRSTKVIESHNVNTAHLERSDPMVDTLLATPTKPHLLSCSASSSSVKVPPEIPAYVASTQCIALQHNDPGESADTVIISTLPSIPFCCHEDLISMSDQQLVTVAQALNDRLPAALRIVAEGVSSTDIRHAIELVVGICRSSSHQSAYASPQEMVLELLDESPSNERASHFINPSSPPTSPIDRHGNPLLSMYSPTCLTKLEECENEDEDYSPVCISTTKRRRVEKSASPQMYDLEEADSEEELVRGADSLFSSPLFQKVKRALQPSRSVNISHSSPPKRPSNPTPNAAKSKIPVLSRISSTPVSFSRPILSLNTQLPRDAAYEKARIGSSAITTKDTPSADPDDEQTFWHSANMHDSGLKRKRDSDKED